MAAICRDEEPLPYDPDTSGITAFLIDLDGTMYRPGALIEGAQEFHGTWLTCCCSDGGGVACWHVRTQLCYTRCSNVWCEPFSHLYVLLSLSDWMVRTGKPFVFLSNTGAKGSPGVQKKFMSEKYKLCDYPVPLRHIWTVSDCEYPNR